MKTSEIYNTAPIGESRLQKELDTFDVLANLGIPFSRVDHEPAMSIEECSDIDKALCTPLCKNLFLTNSAKTAYYLLLMPGEKAFKTREVANQIGSTRLSFGSYDKMEELLNLTPGSVSIMGLMYDSEHKVRLLIDRELLENEYICFHPCINTSSVKAKTKDIFDIFLKYTGHTPTFVEISGR